MARRNFGRLGWAILEWTITGVVVVVLGWLLWTDKLHRWRIETVGNFQTYKPARADAAPLFERSSWRTERERCMDIVDITTDRDLGTRSPDYVQGWMAARHQIILGLSEK